MDRITHKDVEKACARYNAARGLTYPSIGYLQYADIRGDGSNRRGLYVQINENGGVGTAYDLRGKTMRETIANIADATALHIGKEAFGAVASDEGIAIVERLALAGLVRITSRYLTGPCSEPRVSYVTVSA